MSLLYSGTKSRLDKMKTGEARTLKSNTKTTGYGYRNDTVPIAQVFVFRNGTCLGWDCFSKQSIQIGRHSASDIILDDPSIAGNHAAIYIKSGKIVVSAKTHESNLRVNNKPVTSAILSPLDYIGMGPFNLKIKLSGRKDRSAPKQAGPRSVQNPSAKPRIIEKWKQPPQRNTPDTSTQDNQPENAEKKPLVSPPEKDAASAVTPWKTARKAAPQKDPAVSASRVQVGRQNPTMPPDEDDEGEEEEVIRPFLKTALLESTHSQGFAARKTEVLEIIKFKGATIIDLQYLSPRKTYTIKKEGNRFCLAKYTSRDVCHLFFSEGESGLIKMPGAPDKYLADLCTHEYLYKKKKRLYSIAILSGQTFHLQDSGYHYHLRLVPRQESPKVSLPVTQHVPFYKSLLKSTGLHVFIMVFLSLFLSLPEMPEPEEPEIHFVKIDTRQLQKPEPVEPEPKPLPPKLVEPIETKKPATQEKVKPPHPRKLPQNRPECNTGQFTQSGWRQWHNRQRQNTQCERKRYPGAYRGWHWPDHQGSPGIRKPIWISSLLRAPRIKISSSAVLSGKFPDPGWNSSQGMSFAPREPNRF